MLPNRSLNSHIETGNVQESYYINCQKWTNQNLLCFAYSAKIQLIQPGATEEFQKSQKI